jgi:hypothetical protein
MFATAISAGQLASSSYRNVIGNAHMESLAEHLTFSHI